MLPLAVVFERFEREARSGKIGKLFGGIENYQLAKGLPLDCRELAAALSFEDLLGFRASEGNDHKLSIPRRVIRKAEERKAEKTAQKTDRSVKQVRAAWELDRAADKIGCLRKQPIRFPRATAIQGS